MTADHSGTLRIGITGHRPNKLAKADLPRIERQLREAFAVIDAAARRRGGFARISLVSGLAEGADQIAAAACPAAWTIEAVLPFARDEYLKDFEHSAAGDGRDVRAEFLASLARAATVTELSPPPGPRDQGYRAAGHAMLARVDLLIAVWDGEQAKPGGTGEMVREASARGLPVLWLAADGGREPILIARFEEDVPIGAGAPWRDALAERIAGAQPS